MYQYLYKKGGESERQNSLTVRLVLLNYVLVYYKGFGPEIEMTEPFCEFSWVQFRVDIVHAHVDDVDAGLNQEVQWEIFLGLTLERLMNHERLFHSNMK